MSLVYEAQDNLQAKQYNLTVDDKWGPETQRQLGAWMFEHNLRKNTAPLPGKSAITPDLITKIKASPEWARGIDVAKYQLIPDFVKVRDSGISFAFIKSSGSDGTSSFYGDSTFKRNWVACKEAGLLRGAYHFHAFEDDPRMQAQKFYERVGALEPGDLPPVLDLENRTHPIRKEAALAHVTVCLEEIHKLFGVLPFLYTSAGVLSSHGINTVDSGLEKYPLWVPRYGSSISGLEKSVPECYKASKGKRAWTIWQMGYDNDLAGIKPDVDRNFFQGSTEDLLKYAKQTPEVRCG